MADTPESRRPVPAEDVAAAVMGDPVTVAAIAHAGGEPSPGRAEAQAAAEAETILRTSGQRRVSMLWEAVHAIISIMVTGGTLFIAGRLALRDDAGADSTAFLLLSNAFFMIVSSYFARTNHTRVGGVGKGYEGR